MFKKKERLNLTKLYKGHISIKNLIQIQLLICPLLIKMKNKITVIVPVYNVEKYLSQCLENIIHQTYTNLEVICVNDGSTDNSKNILVNYTKIDKRIRIIEKENGGLSSARNVGIKAATGDYIHFIDSDDYIPLNYYEEMIKSLANTNADIVCAGFYFEKHPNESIRFKDTYIYTNINDKLIKIFVYKHMYVWRYLIKTSFIKKNNLSFIEGKYIEDVMFTIPAFTKANKIVVVPNIQYFYRYNQESIMNNKDKNKRNKRKTDIIYMRNLLKEYMKKNNITLTNPLLERTRYKLFGLFPIIEKQTFINKTVYKLFGVTIWEKR